MAGGPRRGNGREKKCGGGGPGMRMIRFPRSQILNLPPAAMPWHPTTKWKTARIQSEGGKSPSIKSVNEKRTNIKPLQFVSFLQQFHVFLVEFIEQSFERIPKVFRRESILLRQPGKDLGCGFPLCAECEKQLPSICNMEERPSASNNALRGTY